MCVTNFQSKASKRRFLKMCLIFDAILLAAAAPLPATPPGSNIEPLYRMFESLNTSEVHAVVHYGRAVGELLVHVNHSNPEFFNQTENELTACSLLAIDEKKKPELLTELSKKIPVIEEVDFDLMLSIVESCQDLQTQRTAPTPAQEQQQHQQSYMSINMWTILKGIVPGTKWCGVNDIAENYHDLGADFELDKCCRAHDHCPVKVKSFSTNYGAKNNHPYTKSHCACDDLFYQCLKQIRGEEASKKAAAVGKVYFNILRLECGEPKYPTVCVQSHPKEDDLGQDADEDIQGFASTNDTSTDYPLRRFFFGVSASVVKSAPSKEVCTQWVEDRDALPNIVFRKPKNYF